MTAPEKKVEIPSRRYGRYVVRSRLGEGGMAEVFLADAVDARGEQVSVALKLMRKDVSPEAFADEADLMGLLSHPNLVSRLEVGEVFGRPFIAMEYLVGGDLGAVIRAHREQGLDVHPALAVHVCTEVLRALAYFHQARTRSGRPLGLVHGDVNPANVFFAADGEVKLGDFGVAKARGMNIGPGDGYMAGKLRYMSPEQTRGEALTGGADLFAVGIMLHELLLGTHPFCREGEQDEARIIAALRAAKLSLPPAVDKQLGAVLRKALMPEASQRYRSAGEFAGALFTWALDTDSTRRPSDVQEWLQGMLGLIV
ncbi:serine/threonine-protein kinase [Myxococcaceae bacterium GXIMD 01537]